MKQLRLYTHTHTHTSDFIENNRKNKLTNNQSNLVVCIKHATTGITLVALVVTIVVLLILAGITLTYVMGDNSVFNRASEAKLKTDIANWKEKLELAKGPVFIDGLGTLNPDKYFEYIEEQGIIEDKEKDVFDNEDGTYDVTTKPGYIFQVELVPTKEKPTDAEIEYIGQAGKVMPIIKRIETSSTQNSITAKAVITRLGNGTVTYYYKPAEAEDSQYQEITNVNTEIGATQNTGITAGEKYTIKVVAKNEAGEATKTVEIAATKVLVESIILNKTKATVIKGKTLTLTATVEPEDATNKTIKWTSSNTTIATVSETGVITGKIDGAVIITAASTDGSGIKATCNITVMDENTAIWNEINEIAKEIANDSSITNSSTQATVTINGENKTIKVGGIYKVRYGAEEKRVRVLGFKHDDLVNTSAYGGNHTKASITFDFIEFMTGTNTIKMNSSNTNSGGWASTKMRSELNGNGSTIGGLGANLSNKAYIKQVKKRYIPTYNVASTNMCNDFLWLLSCSEIWNNGYKSGAYGYGITSEGAQYQYYKGINATYNVENTNLSKKTSETNTEGTWWWLRTPSYSSNKSFNRIAKGGTVFRYDADATCGVAPGFCI